MAENAAEQQRIEDKFAADIARFRELKGLTTGSEDASASDEAAGLATATASSGAD